MNKIALTASIFLGLSAVAYTGAAGYIGLRIDDSSQAKIQHLTAENPRLTVIANTFAHHLFSSDQALRFNVALCKQLPCDPASPALRVQLDTHYKHGPVLGFRQLGLTDFKSAIRLERDSIPAALQAIAAVPPLTVQGRLKLDTQLTATLAIPALHIPASPGDAQTAEWVSAAMQGELQADADFAAYHANLTIPSIRFTDTTPPTVVELTNIRVDNAMRRVLNRVYQGTDSVTVDKIAIQASDTAAEPFALALDTLSSRYTLTESAGFMDASHTLSAQHLRVGQQDYGPLLSEGFARHLQTAALDALIAAFNTALDTPAQNDALLQALRPAALALANNNPVIGIERLKLTLPSGTAQFNYTLALDGLPAAGLDNPQAILSHVRLNAELSATEQAIVEILEHSAKTPEDADRMRLIVPVTMALWARQGYVQRQGDDLRATAQFDGQQFKLNGNRIPLPAFP